MLLLLLLSRFSRVRLCVTPEMAAHQAPLSLRFSRQEHWSGLPFPSPQKECVSTKSLQSCQTLCDPRDCSPLGSSVYGILQTRILEWVPFPPRGDLPNPETEPTTLMSPALTGGFFTSSATRGVPLERMTDCKKSGR